MLACTPTAQAGLLGSVGEGGAIACPERTQLTETRDERGRTAWCHTEDGTAHGPAAAWGLDGERRSESHWLQGRQHGRYALWDQAGVQREEVEWVDGERHGTSASWYGDGLRRSVTEYDRGKRHGRAAMWDESGTQIIEGAYDNDRKHGIWSFRGPGDRSFQAAFGVIIEDVDLTQGVLQSPPTDCVAWLAQHVLLRRGYLSVMTLLSLRAVTENDEDHPDEFPIARCVARGSRDATETVDAVCESDAADFIELVKDATVSLAIDCSR
jgi:hypothetical protein